jgi:2,3-diketo-5-methylthio-1-phosphopentane phosphatase
MIFIIDFDGTLATEDTVDTLLEHHAPPRWEELEADWLAGRISALECMREQIALVRADRITLGKFFQRIQLDPHFLAFWKHVRQFAAVAVVSDGLDYAIQTALRGAGLSSLPVYANQLNFITPDSLELTFPHRQTDCRGGNGVCKCAIAKQLASRHGGPVVLVGDGKSDTCLAGVADMVFAKSSLLKHCIEQKIPHIAYENFSDVLNVVKTWTQDVPRKALA